MAKIMGIDYGDARIGVAFSDLSQTLAGQAYTIHQPNPSKALEELVQIILEQGVCEIVLGFPRNMDGSVGERGDKSLVLAKELEMRTGVAVVLWDERRTTIDAHRILSETGVRGKKRKNKVDAVAATLILQGYLDSKHNVL